MTQTSGRTSRCERTLPANEKSGGPDPFMRSRYRRPILLIQGTEAILDAVDDSQAEGDDLHKKDFAHNS